MMTLKTSLPSLYCKMTLHYLQKRRRIAPQMHWLMLLQLLRKCFKSPNVTPQKISSPTQISSKLSSMKYAQLRRSSLEDLKTLKNLCEEDIISESEFAEEKERILTTLK